MVKQFDPAKIDAAATELMDAAGRLDDHIDAFLTKTQDIGPPCGDAEPIGMLLGVSYAAAEEKLVEALESVVTSLEAHVQKLHVAAANYANTAQDSTATVEAVEV
jgi:hypothetical protein